MSFYQGIKNWLIRTFIVLISFLCFIASSISISANSLTYEHAYRNYPLIDVKNVDETNTTTKQNIKDAITVMQFTCKSESDLVDYGNLAKCCEANAAKGGQNVYRAVDTAELAVIKSTGKFSLQVGGVEAKYFAKSKTGVATFNRTKKLSHKIQKLNFRNDENSKKILQQGVYLKPRLDI